jgi:hypothetical protein
MPFEHPSLGPNTHFERLTEARPKISTLAQASRYGLASPSTAKNIWAIGKSPILLDTLDMYLSKYPDRISAGLLKHGLYYGFRLQYTGPRISVFSKNLSSATDHESVLLEKIHSEVEAGRMSGPF